MLRVDLAVPYRERREARNLGARWDAISRVWFVPEQRDPTAFARWLPASPPPNIRAPGYYIASALAPCRRCRGQSPVRGFALDAGHETLDVDDETGEVCWEMSDEPTLLCYIEFLAPPVAARMLASNSHYRYGFRRSTGSHYWVNVCASCGAKLGDYDTFCEPGVGFMPLTRDQAAGIRLQWYGEPFEAFAGGWSFGVELFDAMSRVE